MSDFWERMDDTFGASYARSIAADHTLTELGGRTIQQALTEGENVKRVWMAVCRDFEDRIPRGLWR